MNIIARIRNDYIGKFGVPRQSGLAEDTVSYLVFEPEYRIKESIRDIDSYDYLWLIWGFSENPENKWSPTVRPPKLGGNTRVGVFATRSPFRPNSLGLSSVKLVSVNPDAPDGAFLCVTGADLMNGTPIYDIKPYIPYTDSHPDARGGFGQQRKDLRLQVQIPEDLEKRLPAAKRSAVREMLSLDPRPGYHSDPQRIYGVPYGEQDIRFQVQGELLTVVDIVPLKQ